MFCGNGNASRNSICPAAPLKVGPDFTFLATTWSTKIAHDDAQLSQEDRELDRDRCSYVLGPEQWSLQ